MTAPNLDLFYSSCTWGDPVGRPEGEKIVIVGESIDEYCDCLSFSSSSDSVSIVCLENLADEIRGRIRYVRHGPAVSVQRRPVVALKDAGSVLLRMTEWLQTYDRVNRGPDVRRQTRDVLRGDIGNAILGYVDHADGEALFDLSNGAVGIHAGAVLTLSRDLETLSRKPLLQRLDVRRFWRVFAVKFVGRNNFSCSDALLQIVLCRHLERKQQIHLMVTGISLRFIDNQSILCHAGFGWQLRDAVRKHLAVGHFLLPQMEIKSQ